jgi:hypothetical protein
LEHEVGDYAVEEESVVVASGDEGGEVFAGLRGVSGFEEGEGRERYFWCVVVVELYYDCAL